MVDPQDVKEPKNKNVSGPRPTEPKSLSRPPMTLGEATIDDGPMLSASGMSMDSSMESSSLLERSRVALMEHSRIALVALRDGTIAQLDADTQSMLRKRLKLAAAVLFLGFTAFLVKHLLQWATTSGTAGFGSLIMFQAGVTVILLFVGLLISYSKTTSLLGLRLAELIIFGLPMVFFLAVQGVGMVSSLAKDGRIGFFLGEGPWLVLMFTYALFIPNTLKRAAVVIGFIAAAPVLLSLLLKMTNSVDHSVLTWEHWTYFTLLLAFCGAGSVFGVQTIDTLRHEAYEARQLGHYKLKERIGVGGMGEVYKAEHQLLKRPCVIKLIKPEKAGDSRVLARFKREVRATSKLTHWNTIAIFDYGSTSDGVFYYVMEYLPGMNLSEIIKRYGPMSPDRVVHVLRQACEALAEAHCQGLVHRDIKPGNIFLAERGGVHDVVKLLDFGLVKPAQDDQDLHLTTEGSIIGSPLFMSPEQAMGDAKPDARSDLYSLGAVGYYLLTGRPPFEGDQPIKVIMAHAQQEVEPPSKFCPDLPEDLEQVILKCLAKKPDDRFQTATDMADTLDECQSAHQWTRREAAQWWEDHPRPNEPVHLEVREQDKKTHIDDDAETSQS